jgi:hypothetical protein
LVVAERLYAGKVFKPSALSIEEGFVNSEIVRIPMDVSNRFAERNHLIAQHRKKIVKAIRLPVGFDKRRRIAQWRPGSVR